MLPTIRELGIGLVPYSPLGRGLLTGAIDPRRPWPTDDTRAAGRFPRFEGDALDANLALVEQVRELAARKGVTAGPAGPRLGARPGRRRRRRSPAPSGCAYLEENVAAAGVTLSGDDLAALDAAVPRAAVVGDRYADMSSVNA